MRKNPTTIFALIALLLTFLMFHNCAYATGLIPNMYVSGNSFVASGVISTTPNTGLMTIIGYNSLASAQFIYVFDSATVPADATGIAANTCGFILAVPASSTFIWTGPRTCINGISWSNSTTAPVKTLGAANIWLEAIFG